MKALPDVVILPKDRLGYIRVECDNPLIWCPLCGAELKVFERVMKGSTDCVCGAMITFG